MKADLLVVGAGLSGATVAEVLARKLGWKIVIVERRAHVAGNAYDCMDKHGVFVHMYGPHIFHTDNAAVWRYLCRFTKWRYYKHYVSIRTKGTPISVPFNLDGLPHFFSIAKARKLRSLLIDAFGDGASVPVNVLRDYPNPLISNLGELLYRKVYLPYTLKQWGVTPDRLDRSVMNRVPVRICDEVGYFEDSYQGVPNEGYTKMVLRMLDHPNIDLHLNTDFRDIKGKVVCRRLVYTGPVDELFKHKHGDLPYRSVRFCFRHFRRNRVQATGSVHNPGRGAFTRACEYKHITGQRVFGTTVSYEYPCVHTPGITEPYYPIPQNQANLVYKMYASEASRVPGMYLCGRLASYRYFDMDETVAQALRLAEHVRKSATTTERSNVSFGRRDLVIV